MNDETRYIGPSGDDDPRRPRQEFPRRQEFSQYADQYADQPAPNEPQYPNYYQPEDQNKRGIGMWIVGVLVAGLIIAAIAFFFIGRMTKGEQLVEVTQTETVTETTETTAPSDSSGNGDSGDSTGIPGLPSLPDTEDLDLGELEGQIRDSLGEIEGLMNQ